MLPTRNERACIYVGCLLTRVLPPYARPCALRLAFCELTKKIKMTGGMWMTYGEVLNLCCGWVGGVGGA